MQMKREGVKWNLTLVLCCETFRRQKKGSVVIIPLSIQSKMMPCKSNRVCVYINPKRKRFQFRSLFLYRTTDKQTKRSLAHKQTHCVYTKSKSHFFQFWFLFVKFSRLWWWYSIFHSLYNIYFITFLFWMATYNGHQHSIGLRKHCIHWKVSMSSLHAI